MKLMYQNFSSSNQACNYQAKFFHNEKHFIQNHVGNCTLAGSIAIESILSEMDFMVEIILSRLGDRICATSFAKYRYEA